MTTIEDLVRAAQQRQADRAVPAETVLPALSERIIRHRRHRRGVASAGAAAVAAAVALTAPQLLRAESTFTPPPPPPVVKTPPPSPAPVATTAPMRTAPLGFRPTWVPAGFREFHRSADNGPTPQGDGPVVERIWRRSIGPGDPGNGASLTLQVREVPPGTPADPNGEAIDVGGRAGRYVGADGDQKSYLTWTVDQRTRLTLSANRYDISRQNLLRMARSVVPDPGTFEPPVQVRWLPDGWAMTALSVSGPDPATWRSESSLSRPPTEPPSAKTKSDPEFTSAQLIVGTVTEAPDGGAELTVNGRPARAPRRTDPAGQTLAYLVVDMGGGRLMTLIGDGGATTLNTLILIADRVEVTPAGANWLGAR